MKEDPYWETANNWAPPFELYSPRRPSIRNLCTPVYIIRNRTAVKCVCVCVCVRACDTETDRQRVYVCELHCASLSYYRTVLWILRLLLGRRPDGDWWAIMAVSRQPSARNTYGNVVACSYFYAEKKFTELKSALWRHSKWIKNATVL